MSGTIAALFYDESRGAWRWIHGKETYYNERNEMIEFYTSEEAFEWLKEEHPDMTIEVKEGQQYTLDMKGDT